MIWPVESPAESPWTLHAIRFAQRCHVSRLIAGTGSNGCIAKDVLTEMRGTTLQDHNGEAAEIFSRRNHTSPGRAECSPVTLFQFQSDACCCHRGNSHGNTVDIRSAA